VVENAKVSNTTAGDNYSYLGLFTSEPIVILYYKKYSDSKENLLKKHFLQLRLSVLALSFSVKERQSCRILIHIHKYT